MAKTPARADAVRNREKILTVARKCFTEQGLEISLDSVAKRAGVGAGTLYRHFPGRDALVAEVLTAEMGNLEADHQALREADLGPEERLERWSEVLRSWMTSYVGLPEPLRCALDESGSALGTECEAVIGWTDEFVEAAKADGVVRPFVTGRSFYRTVLGAAWVISSSAAAQGKATTTGAGSDVDSTAETDDDAEAVLRLIRDGWRAEG